MNGLFFFQINHAKLNSFSFSLKIILMLYCQYPLDNAIIF